ncbi:MULTISPECIES: (5-formylfuran-3-yl)methyl phosphate synthase [unclassified Mesorhizobium]|uniref:(5-formylfuran-3-yl)methyl phosphate synthase n=1 Tax=unclassified Mesorhizobium TaxID=325217 RepID=UPI00112784E9|nr:MULTISPECIES: (5-formylfuran-3-yl)methyl phosphate synthase [unclassified Mesorhizobium]TPK46566.1 FolB domain-containing protein [Mesorhizobium sp. B2-5-2]TPL22026.1 FolB domain-containing protein [Mesorhizobium sp. B2-4-9]TPL30704.1 FolB domain-containing protein [Mesorhizobium sp. B2-4-7]TPL36243.1 FolB domain-containing protein [Mesorhizobium sp. B2-4-5]TPM72274.1 FolB domain-containing protein [Mesorhizobium sp. B2-1-6]
MTRMLASVTGIEEAEIVLSSGADIVDLKDPKAGALGAVPTETIRRTISFIAGRAPVSAVCGDLPMEPETIRAKAEEIAATGVDYVKIGFFPSAHIPACAEALEPLAARTKLIAVLFADLAPDFELLPVFGRHRFRGVMVDTAQKGKGRLLDHLPPERIPGFVDRAKSLGLMVGLSGSLEAPDIPRLLPFAPDFLGFRGALCGHADRAGSISAEAVSQIRELVPAEPGTGGKSSIDYRLLAARGYSPGTDPTLGTDRIFVRDFVLPVQIGAYSFEHGHTQKVRFDVIADVLQVTDHPEDMRHVFSYDIIMDGIRTIVARGHIQLSEALAEQVAAHVLENQRVVRVTVRVEKLELGPGGVGVEIERKRQSAGRGVASGSAGRKDRGSVSRPRQQGSDVLGRAVVKLGGSTAHAAEMTSWIAALAGSRLPIVIVPGGGLFADQVRETQTRMDFSDTAAHAMAILAMEQFGQIILDRDERLTPARSLEEIVRALDEGKVPVWLPSSLALPAPDLPASWDITSDSLAAWLGGKLGANALLLIKQTDAFFDNDTPDSLKARGIVDPGFAAMLPDGIDFRLAGPKDAAEAGALLASGKLPGIGIVASTRSAKKAG